MKWIAITLLLFNSVLLVMKFTGTEAPRESFVRFPFPGPHLMLVSENEKLAKAKALAEEKKQRQSLEAKAAQETASPKVAPAEKSEAAKPASRPVEVARPAALACYSVGPFLLISDVSTVSQRFDRAGISAQQRADTERKQVGYWLYIPAMASAPQARAALRTLKDNGVSGALLIAEGSRANSISIGVYKTRELAGERQKTISGMGFGARVEPLFRTKPQYWLDIELANKTRLPDKTWREVTAGYPHVQQLRRKCE
jgi:hypothetical protein